MKKIFLTLSAAVFALAAYAQDPEVKNPEAVAAEVQAVNQDVQTVAAEAAAAAEAAPEEVKPEPKPQYWTINLQHNINFGQTALYQWSAGGFNNISLAAGVDYSFNFAKDKMIWNNRLQLDYGAMWSADKPILQKHKDRIYFESKWGLETPAPHLSWSAFFDLRTQFHNNYDYPTPSGDWTDVDPSKEDWLNARILKSGFLSPLYMNLGLGLLWTPKPWFSLNFAPITGGVVVVMDDDLRYIYGMDLRRSSSFRDTQKGRATDAERKAAYEAGEYGDFLPVRPEFGAQLKLDAKWEVNDNFSYSTQLAVFYNYLTPKIEPRVNWDHKIFWKMAKYFALSLSANFIYDPLVLVRDNRNALGEKYAKGDKKDGVPDSKGIQIKEYLELGFTYTFASKK